MMLFVHAPDAVAPWARDSTITQCGSARGFATPFGVSRCNMVPTRRSRMPLERADLLMPCTVAHRRHFILGAAQHPAADRPQVVLTRESGKNGKLKKALEGRGVSCLEMPLLETAPGPDTQRLPEVLRREGPTFDWVCITSPEAASVFIEGWRKAGCPAVRVAVVGDGTGRILTATREPTLVPQFTPSVANAEHFGPELPFVENGAKKVLYPASNKASSALQEGLLARGFDVARLNTYDTLPVATLDDDQLELAKRAEVVAIASPSALRAWLKFVGDDAADDVAIACIGSTSGQAAKKLGLQRVFYPEEPSLDNFVTTILQALEACGHARVN